MGGGKNATHASYGRAIDRLSARLNRKGRQERQDIAKDLLPIANKKFLLCALCVLRGSNGWVGKTKHSKLKTQNSFGTCVADAAERP
jgi:hypothetical protein